MTNAVLVAAFERLRDAGWPGRALVTRLRPAHMGDIDSAEAEVEAAANALRADSTGCDRNRLLRSMETAVGRWEALVRGTAVLIRSLCHDCGREAPIALADASTGERFCQSCIQFTGDR